MVMGLLGLLLLLRDLLVVLSLNTLRCSIVIRSALWILNYLFTILTYLLIKLVHLCMLSMVENF